MCVCGITVVLRKDKYEIVACGTGVVRVLGM